MCEHPLNNPDLSLIGRIGQQRLHVLEQFLHDASEQNCGLQSYLIEGIGPHSEKLEYWAIVLIRQDIEQQTLHKILRYEPKLVRRLRH